MKLKKAIKIFLLPSLILSGLGACSKSESYSNLLRNEEKTVNWFLSGQKVCIDIPADSVLLYGDDAPYYKLNEEGTVYMKVLNPGDLTPGRRPKNGEKVYFRYSRRNLQYLQAGESAPWQGNSTTVSGTPTYFVYGNTYLPNTVSQGEGVQLPLKFVGYNSQVLLVMKASMGNTEEQAACVPFQYDIRYFKAEY